MTQESSSDLSSADDVPLTTFAVPSSKRPAQNGRLLTKKDLLKYSQEKCEFCEELLFCSYDMLVHNAKHIIIPLRDELARCTKCGLVFGNLMDLEIHTKIQHFEIPALLKSLVMNEPVVKCDSSVTELVIQNNEKKLDKILHKKAVVKCDSTVTELINKNNFEKLKDLVVKQPVIRCEDTIKVMLNGNSITECDEKLKTDLDSSVQGAVLKQHDLIDNDFEETENNPKPQIIDNGKSEMLRSLLENNKINNTSKIKSRLIFEDDDSEFEDDIITTHANGVINDQTNSCQVVCDLTIDSDEDDTMVAPDTTTVDCEENIVPAVHYDDLQLPCWLKCSRCGQAFSNRYELITHDTKVHLELKQHNVFRLVRVCTVCDRYIVGNHWTMKRHMDEKHPLVTSKHQTAFKLKSCDKCNLRYFFYPRHSMNYHCIYSCQTCSKGFQNESRLTEHIQTCRGKFDTIPEILEDRIGMEKIIKVCEVCSIFLKDTQILKYVHLRDYSEKGKRVHCERCEKKFFEVKLIKLINKHTIVQPHYEYQRKNLPTTSNEKRLKKIQRRLKLMKKFR